MSDDNVTEAAILLLEDNIYDAELIKFALEQSGLPFTLNRVGTRREFEKSLLDSTPDLILSDYRLPDINGLDALKMAQEMEPGIPFIFVTGTLGEERAIETLKRGATDYVLKTRLSHLVPAVHRALREAEMCRERIRAEERLRESREQLRALSVYLQYVREEERTRIAREVHDELGQSLTGLKLDLAWMTQQIAKNQPTLLERLRTMSGQIDSTIQTVRRIATELRPGILDDLGLIAALEWQANEFQSLTGIECIVRSEVDDSALDVDINTAFFRIFQETLTNVARHAKATRVRVLLQKGKRELNLVVRDDGRGITSTEIHDTNSIGLLGMRERAGLLGGKIQFESEPGKGTVVSVTIPQVPSRRNRKTAHENSHRR